MQYRCGTAVQRPTHLHQLFPQLALVHLECLLEERSRHATHGSHQALPLARPQLLCRYTMGVCVHRNKVSSTTGDCSR
jgi:hypothetical protein